MKPILKTLTGPNLMLRPALITDLEPLFQLAKDPDVWALHRHKDRGERAPFETFFLSGLINTMGMYTVQHLITGEILGTSRYYNYDPKEPAVHIGYTFLGKKFWGSGMNAEMKALMLTNALRYVKAVYLDVFELNIRSHKAVRKLGAKLYKVSGDRYIYKISRGMWQRTDPVRNMPGWIPIKKEPRRTPF